MTSQGMTRASVRLADALLRSVGGRTVLLRLPAPAIPGDLGEQTGLASPQFQDIALGPAAFRKVRATYEADGVAYELLVSASAVRTLTGSLDYNSVAVLFSVAAGVVVDGTLLEITSAVSAEAFGEVYLYRVGLRGAAINLI